MISDQHALGFIWLDQSADFDYRNMAGLKIVNPLIVFTKKPIQIAPTQSIIAQLANDPVFLEYAYPSLLNLH